MSKISFEAHLALDIEMTSSRQAIALPISIGAIGLGSGQAFYVETKISPFDLDHVGRAGENGPDDKGPLAAAGFTIDDILMTSKPTIQDGLEAFFAWSETLAAGRIAVTQGSLDLAVLERCVRNLSLVWPYRFHSSSDLRSWAVMAAILKGVEIPLTRAGTSPMNLKSILAMFDIQDRRDEAHISLVDAALTAQLASYLLRDRPFFDDLDSTIQQIVTMVERYRLSIKDGSLVGQNAILSANLEYLA